jgi:uncharacterized protein YyaL (SSP411 family)
VVGQGADADALLAVARKLPHATTIILYAPNENVLPADHPARAKIAASAGAAAFVCRGQSCSLPVTTPEDLIELVNAPEGD